MKKAFLYAYDKVNLGDDLFVRMIANRYPHVQFYLWSNKINKMVFKENKNIKVINKDSLYLKVLQKIRPSFIARYQEAKKKKCDAVIYIGGSIFIEYPTWKNIVNWWRYQSEHYPFYVIGANFGPYETDEYRREMRKIFDNMKDVCFRDKYSFQLFKECNQVRCAPDILFSYPIPRINKKENQVFISVINFDKKEEGKYTEYTVKYEDVIVKIVKEFLALAYSVKLVSFCKEEGDEETADRIKEKLDGIYCGDQIEIIRYNGVNGEEILYQMAVSGYVVATRFHAIVLGFVARVPVFPIVYSNKSKNLLCDMEFSGKYCELDHLDEFRFEDILYNEKEIVDLGETIVNSKGHFRFLDCELLSVL